MIRISQVKLRADTSIHAVSHQEALKKKAARILGIREDEIGEFRIVRQSIDARKKPEIYYSYVVDVSLNSGRRGNAGSRRSAEGRRSAESGHSAEVRHSAESGHSAEVRHSAESGHGAEVRHSAESGSSAGNMRGMEVRRREEQLVRRLKNDKVTLAEPCVYRFPARGTVPLQHRPVIIGAGPAGLFCAYFLAREGYRPLLLERGADVDSRREDVERFWKEGVLNPDSNVQFGEGGAGTFSDGKLNTLVKDKYGRNQAVLETFVRFGARESILYEAKPHLGTDLLRDIVRRMREEIISLGGEVRFHSQVTAFGVEEGRMRAVYVGEEEVLCEQVVLAIGHSARDTLETLYQAQVSMEPRPFAVGLRLEHPQSMINQSQYGMEDPGCLGAALYKVTAQTSLGRGVYSFCMCPGGYVVNASSEPGRLAVNGMSYSTRAGQNANSAIVVTVTPEDYPSAHPLAGIAFQRELEERAYQLGNGKIPVQRYGEFKQQVDGDQGPGGWTKEAPFTAEGQRAGSRPADSAECSEWSEGALKPQTKGACVYADVSRILPADCNLALVEGMTRFGRMIPGFDRPDALLSGVESRTSSPVRILRDETLQSPAVRGLYPCGEGAGYAGGITSAAMDGIRVAEIIAGKYAPYGGE